MPVANQDILDRMENWRRYFRRHSTTTTVPWYTPPDCDDIDRPSKTIAPIDANDATLLEHVWRNLRDDAKKTFIKLEFIQQAAPQVIRRKMRKQGVIIRNAADHTSMTATVLRYFTSALAVAEGK